MPIKRFLCGLGLLACASCFGQVVNPPTGGGGGTGTVTSISSGNLPPLFTVSVTNPTTSAALVFALSNAAQNSVLAGPATGGAGAPSYQTAPTFSGVNLTGFAASAFTDTTNANNINSGTLPTPQTAALTGDVTKAAGSNATTLAATTNATLTTLSALSLPQSQVTGLGTFATQNYATPPTLGGTTPGMAGFSGDTSGTPSYFCSVTSTNSTATASSPYPADCGSTTGIAVGQTCSILHTFISGSNWMAWANCVNNGTEYWYSSASAAIGSESYAQRATLNNTGTFTTSGSFIASSTVQASKYSSAGNCASSASPAVCSSSLAGAVTVAAAATTEVVNTSAVTANSEILLTFDSSLGTRLSVTCNTTAPTTLPTVSSRTAGTSFTITTSSPSTNPDCFSFLIIN